jgi:hypothetical protein
MHGLSAAQILLIWERGQGLSFGQKAMLLLMTAAGDERPEHLTQLSIGERDSRLLALRTLTFGPRLEGLAKCPACGESVEVSVNAPELCADTHGDEPEDRFFSMEGYELRFRLPNGVDLASLAPETEIADARSHLLRRCLREATYREKPISFEDLPDQTVVALTEQISQADPQADIQLALNCPHCSHEWRTPFDIVSFFWTELSSRALRVLHEVHALASAYGWSESEVLALSPWRRQAYLELVPA